MNWRAVFGGTIGWMVDVYDLTLLLFVTSIIANAFFPSNNALLSTLSVFTTYALSLLARPLGGVLFGHVADKIGRRITMMITLLGLGIFSALSGSVPTYAEIGILAPIIFVILRLLVGIFVGGEVSGSHLIAVEASDDKRRGLISGILQSGYYWGYALAAVTFLAMSSYFGANFASYGWRYAFYLSIVVSIIGLLLRLAVGESQLFDEVKKEGRILRVPISEVFKEYFSTAMIALLVMSGIYWVAYATLGYLPTYLLRNLKYSFNFTFSSLVYAGIIGAVMTILGGVFSDHLKRKLSFVIYAIIGLLLSIPAIQMLYTTNFLFVSIGAGLITGFIGLAGGVMLAYLSELFATNVRASAIGFIWNMANIGSTIGLILAPIVTTYSVFWGYSILLVGGYLVLLVGAAVTTDNTGIDLRKLELKKIS